MAGAWGESTPDSSRLPRQRKPGYTAGLAQHLPELWAAADLSERRRLLLTVLDAVYVDAHETRALVSVRPKAAFEAVLAESSALTASVRR